MTADLDRVVLIGVAGDSGCGKSTFLRRLIDLFGEEFMTVICLDDYHSLDRKGRKAAGVTALNPKAIDKPIYNHETGELDPPERIEPNKVVVIEGLHPLYDERVREIVDFSVYLDISDEVKIQWKIQRDMSERGHTYEDILASIKAREPDFKAYIEVQREFADVVIQVLPTELVKGQDSDLLRVRLIQKEGVENFDTVYLFDEGSTIHWRPCGRKLECPIPGIKMYYGPDSFYNNEVSILEVDGEFGNLEQMIYIESHLSNTSTDHYGEMTELLLKHKDYPGSKNGTGLFQVLVGLKMRETYEKLTATTAQPAQV